MSVFSNDENVLQIRLEKARRNYQDALVFLENDYRSIAQIMHSYYPLAVLSKAAWHCYQVYTGGKTDEYSLSAARLFPVLLQSVYQSRYYTNRADTTRTATAFPPCRKSGRKTGSA